MSNKTVLRLIYGGKSAEHEVSLQTALSVIQALDMTKFVVIPMYISLKGQWFQGPKLTGAYDDVKQLIFDNKANGENVFPPQFFASISESEVVFPLLHGPNGEDGTVQGLLELLNVAYVGNEVAASAVGMDKVFMKQLFAQHRLNQPNYLYFTKNKWRKKALKIYEKIETALGFPCFVKPANLGSSVGISKCHTFAELEQGVELAFQYDRKIIVEEAIDGREIEIAVLGNDEPQCSVAGEIIPDKDFYDYHAKYEDDNTSLIIPAEIPEHVSEEMKTMAVQAFQAIGGSGLVRADFFVTEDYEVLINEINTMPGFTPFSMFPLLWKHSGLTYEQLIERLVTLAIERYEEKQNIKYTME